MESTHALNRRWNHWWLIDMLPSGLSRVVGNSAIRRAFGIGGAAPVRGDECVHGLVLPFGQPLVEAFGDADGGVIVADLGLVVPEHRQPAVSAQAVPPGTDHLSDAAAGEHGGFPHVAQSTIERVVLGGQTRKVVLVGQRAGDLVRKRAARGLAGCLARGGGGDDELPSQADPFCASVVGCVAQQLADRVEHQRAGGRGDDAGRPIGAFHRQRRQAVAFAAALVGDEPAHVLAVEQPRVVPALGCIDLQEDAQFGCCPADSVEDAAGAGRLRRLQQPGQVIPDQIPQPALRDAGEVEMAAPVWKPDAEVVGLDESGVAGVGGRVVDQPQLALDLLGDRAGESADSRWCRAASRPASRAPGRDRWSPANGSTRGPSVAAGRAGCGRTVPT